MVLGSTVQKFYDMRNKDVQIVILNRDGHVKYHDPAYNQSKKRLLLVSGKNYFAGVISPNPYFKTQYFCKKNG